MKTDLYVIEQDFNGKKAYYANSATHGNGWSDTPKQAFTKTELQAAIFGIVEQLNIPLLTFRRLELFSEASGGPDCPKAPPASALPDGVAREILDALADAKNLLNGQHPNLDKRLRGAIRMAEGNVMKGPTFTGRVGPKRGIFETSVFDQVSHVTVVTSMPYPKLSDVPVNSRVVVTVLPGEDPGQP